MAEYITIARTGEMEPGKSRVVEVKGKSIAVFNIDGTLFAIDNVCLHMGGPVGEGTLSGSVVTCPWHGWQYNVETGVKITDPEQKLQTYEVKVEGDEIKIAVNNNL
jgi:nitrite reductase/ring-hydroxylating ferredoxin subunit